MEVDRIYITKIRSSFDMYVCILMLLLTSMKKKCQIKELLNTVCHLTEIFSLKNSAFIFQYFFLILK